MDLMKIAIIGYGGMGKQHMKRIENNKHMEVIAVYDVNKEKDFHTLSPQIKVLQTFEEVLANEEIEAIIIATPNNSHHQLAITALKSGKHVICEKPVTMNHTELEDIVAHAKKYHRVFMVNQNRRWDEGYLIMKKLLEEGTLGELYYLESRVMGSRGIPSDWRRIKEAGGGMILDWAPHLIDRILLLFPDEKVTSIYASLNYFLKNEVDDGFKLFLTFSNGKKTLMEVGTSNFIELPEWYMVGSTGTAIIEDYNLNGRYIKLTGEFAKDAIPVETGAGLTKTMAPRNDNSIAEHPLPKVTSNVNEFYDNFFHVVRNNTTPIVKNEEVLRVMKLIDFAFTSSEKNQVIQFENGI